MHLIYIDDSGDEEIAIFSALAIPVIKWHESFRLVRDFRRDLKKNFGIYVYKELHAWKFISGRGRPSPNIITKSQRASIFINALELISSLPGARLFNTIAPKSKQEEAFEWMLNRINRTLTTWKSYGLIISDEGKEPVYTRLVRKMYVFNPIPSKFGAWEDTGKKWKDIPLDRLVEDPFFKDSTQSYFVQLADFCAYSLLRRENPLPSKSKYGIDRAFSKLNKILVKEASNQDPEGIIRLK